MLSKLTYMHSVKGLAVLAASFSILSAASLPVVAADWVYSRDAPNDSYSAVGSNAYEIYGMGFKDDGEDVWIGINSQLGIGGNNLGTTRVGNYTVEDANIGWGDLFFDFSPERSYEGSHNSYGMFGVHFAANNDTWINGNEHAPIGVYSNVRGVGVQGQNAGFWNLGSQREKVRAQKGAHTESSVGYMSAYEEGYYGQHATNWSHDRMANSIQSGHFLGGIEIVDHFGLANAGFNTGVFGQSNSPAFGFKFNRSLLPTGAFVASLFQECLNDGVALGASILSPPITDPPITDPPITDPPITDPPITDPPITDPPITDPPITDPPITDPPITDPPITDPPITDPPITHPPITHPPITEEIPEPSSVLAVFLTGGLGLLRKKKGKK